MPLHQLALLFILSPLVLADEPPKPIRTLTGHTGSIMSVALSPDGTRAVSGGQDQTTSSRSR